MTSAWVDENEAAGLCGAKFGRSPGKDWGFAIESGTGNRGRPGTYDPEIRVLAGFETRAYGGSRDPEAPRPEKS